MQTVRTYYYNYEKDFRIFTMKDNHEVVLYDTTKTQEDVPTFLMDCLIEKIYAGSDGADELEI